VIGGTFYSSGISSSKMYLNYDHEGKMSVFMHLNVFFTSCIKLGKRSCR